MDEWVTVLLALLAPITTLGGVALGGWLSRQQARDDRKAQREEGRQQAVREALAAAKLVLDHAIPKRYHFSFHKEESPKLLEVYKRQWSAAEPLLVRAEIDTSPKSELNEALFQLRRSVEHVLHWLTWGTLDKINERDELEAMKEAVECHEKAMAVAARIHELVHANTAP